MSLLYAGLAIVLAIVLALLLTPLLRDHSLQKPQRQRFAVAIALIFCIAAFSLYRLLGAPEIIPMMQQREVRMSELKDIILKRSGEVKTNPKNLAAWVELGQSFMETGQYGGAANAFKQAVILSEGNPALILAYADAQIAQADGKVTDEAKKALEMVLLQQPENEKARYFIAVRQLQDGDTTQAMKNMKALYHSLAEDSPVKAMIDRQIGKQP